MDWANPVEWFAWIYGKLFQNHYYIGALSVMVVFALAGLMLWVRGVDKYKEEHPAPKAEAAVLTTNQPSIAATNQPQAVSTQNSPAKGHPAKAKSLAAHKTQQVVSQERTTPQISLRDSPGSAISINQQGGITAGTIINPPPNPNHRVVIYDCVGSWRSTKPGVNAAMEFATCLPDKCEKIDVYNSLVALYNTAANEKAATGLATAFSGLRARCEEEIGATPEWLTPYLFCGLADAALGDTTKLRARLAYYDEHAGITYNTDECKKMSDYLHGILNP